MFPFGFVDKSFLNAPIDEEWKGRIDDVTSCPDNKLIKRNPDAGIVKGGAQIMHNGIKVTVGGYYGAGITQMLYKNKGVHEPQEEYAFDLVLNSMPKGATMIELGAYWSFYSIWFQKKTQDGKSFLVEPDVFNMSYGENNFRINKVKGKFHNAFVGAKTEKVPGSVGTVCVDDLAKEEGVEFIDILHSDIQGAELDMLHGAQRMISNYKIGYFFISTHGNKVHYECIDFLKAANYQILCHADESQTYSVDGLIVAKSPMYEGIQTINISLKDK